MEMYSHDAELRLDHFLHGHTLSCVDVEDGYSLTCSGCKKQVSGRSYSCLSCGFYLHESCANIPFKIYHFTHSCPLILTISNTRTCEACGEPCRGFFYDCGPCSWGVHYSCTLKQLPNATTNPEAQEQIESPLHRHPLSTVVKIREDNGVLCEVCGDLCFGPTYYECSVCSFYAHKSCVEIPKQLYSFYHQCRYFLVLLICQSYECGACTRAGFGVSYACIKCGFQLHLKCALRLPGNFEGLPQMCRNLMKKIDCLSCKFPFEKPCSEHLVELQTPLHPEHTLFLYKSPDTRQCNVCLGDCSSGFFFRCDKCDYYYDPECIYLKQVHYDCTLKQLPNTITNPEAQEQIEPPLHRHPLSTVEKMREDNGVLCEVCGELCFGPIYYECSDCSFYVHKSCMEIPKKLYSLYHKCRYFLTLLLCRSYECGACTQAGFGVSYACIRCGFKLHLKCALWLPGNFEGLPHICHNLMKKTDCLGCKFPLEKPCSEHMLEVQTLLHLEHTLFLYKSPDTRRCNVCLGDCPSGFFFRCDECDFYCGPECIYLIPTIQFANHGHHLLTVVDRVHDDVECDICRKICKGKPAFRCLECKFNLHLLCGPLPHTIKHEHVHRLTFEDYIIQDKDEQYCYHCEEKRDPLLCVYYCKGCSYTAEVDCVMSEVIACLRGESEETVVLRCLNKKITKNNRVIIRGNAVEKLQNNAINEDLSEDELETEPSLFLDDVFECLNEDEQHKFRDNIKTMVTELSWPAKDNDMLRYSDKEYIEEESSGSYNDQISQECSGNERRGHDHNIPEVSPYSEKAFTQLIEKLDSGPGSRKKIKLVLSDDEKQLVKYGKYITPRLFIPILKGLINDKHGDISSESMLDPRIKSICFMYLSEVIYSMRTIKVLNIKEDILHTWWNRTKMLELLGFKVGFIKDHLMLVARAYFGLKASNFANETSEKQVSKIEQLEEKIKVLMGRVEELKLQHRNHLEYVNSAKTPLMDEYFSDAKAMKWRPAAEGLLRW